jgi:DNA mismatch endonuclease (patch repair protein)
MSRIRSAGTAPEARLYLCVRTILGGRWRIDMNVRALPGQPDIVVPRLRLAIFADGCFYHCCPRHGHYPKSNRGYWAPKLEHNQRRDRINRRALRRLGYKVWRFWEHDLKPLRAESVTGILRRRISKLRREQDS